MANAYNFGIYFSYTYIYKPQITDFLWPQLPVPLSISVMALRRKMKRNGVKLFPLYI